MATVADGMDRGLRIKRRRTAWCAALLCAAMWTVAGGGGSGPQVVGAQPGAAAAEPPGLRPIAHVGGGLNGLAVDGDVVYIGEGADVVTLRMDAEAQIAVVHRTPLPAPVSGLVIAREVDTLYATAGDSVYALDIAQRLRPAVREAMAVPLAARGDIVAAGGIAYVQVQQYGRPQGRCVVALMFRGSPGPGEVSSFACATDIPEDAWLVDERLLLGDDVLAVVKGEFPDEDVPAITLFDIREPSRPRFTRSMMLPHGVLDAVIVGDRLWVVDDWRDVTTLRAYDVSDPDREPIVVAEGKLSHWADRMFVADGEVWVTGHGQSVYRSDATGALSPARQRWILGCYGFNSPNGRVAVTNDAMLTLDASLLWVCRMPRDDAHEVHERASWYGGEVLLDGIAATGGRTFARGDGGVWLNQYVHGLPNLLVPFGASSLPPIVDEAATRHPRIDAIDADADHLVVAQDGRVSAFRLPADARPVPAAVWHIPRGTPLLELKAVAVAGDRAAVLRTTDLFVIDLARPDAPVQRIADRWQSAHGLAAGSAWAAVLAGGDSQRGRPQTAPQVILVDVRSSPPAVLGELILADREGWFPSGIARAGDYVAVALRQRSGGRGTDRLLAISEVVVVDTSDPSRPAVVGRAAIEAGTGAEAMSIAATSGQVVVGGWAYPTPDPAAPSGRTAQLYHGALWAIDITAPERPVVRGPYAVPGLPTDISIDGRDVLVSAGDGGLWRFELVRPGDVAVKVWRLALPWVGPGQREMSGQPVPMRPVATTPP